MEMTKTAVGQHQEMHSEKKPVDYWIGWQLEMYPDTEHIIMQVMIQAQENKAPACRLLLLQLLQMTTPVTNRNGNSDGVVASSHNKLHSSILPSSDRFFMYDDLELDC